MPTRLSDVTVPCSVCNSTGQIVTLWIEVECPWCREARVKEYDRLIELELIEEQGASDASDTR